MPDRGDHRPWRGLFGSGSVGLDGRSPDALAVEVIAVDARAISPPARRQSMPLRGLRLDWGEFCDDAAARDFIQTLPFVAFRPATSTPA